LDRWEPLATPRSPRSTTSSAGGVKIDVGLQPPSADGSALRLPVGIATLALLSPNHSAIGAFDTTGQEHTHAVALPGSVKEPTMVAAYARVPTDSSSPIAELEARLWYRGHVKSKPLPLPSSDNSQFVEYEFVRSNYAPPTVEVRGKDTLRGAVMFVFDCSSSMRTPDHRFENAKDALAKVLSGLDRDSGPNLRVGLMAYGRRTPADGLPPIFYSFTKLPNAADNLTDLGRTERDRLGAQFKDRFPHPDRDVEICAPVATSTAADAAKELAKFEFDKCRGCTPLYYSIQQALDHGFAGLPRNVDVVRQVVVISDGVNMPYESYQGRIGEIAGTNVNNSDLEALKDSVQRHAGDTQISVILFGNIGQTPVEQAQLAALNRLAANNINFRVFPVQLAVNIEQTIRNAFPKAAIELRGTDASGGGQPLTFHQPVSPRDWPTDGMLRREPLRQTIRLNPPGETRTIDRDVELLGGERVVLQYEARDGRMSFIRDDLTFRKSALFQSSRPSDNRRLLLDALDPERVGLTVSKFHFRLRDEDESQRFAARAKYVWLELRPVLGSGESSERAFPCIDVMWKENINFPRLQMPVERWPDAPTARVKAWLRYSDPLALAQVTLARDRSSQLMSAGSEKWQVEQSGGDAGSPRKITVTWEPTDGQPGLQRLLDRAVWLSPAPDNTRRQYALDGSTAIHEFTYNRSDVANVEIRVVTRDQFEQGAYLAELEFSTAN
jgi:hypothetical protein